MKEDYKDTSLLVRAKVQKYKHHNKLKLSYSLCTDHLRIKYITVVKSLMQSCVHYFDVAADKGGVLECMPLTHYIYQLIVFYLSQSTK